MFPPLPQSQPQTFLPQPPSRSALFGLFNNKSHNLVHIFKLLIKGMVFIGTFVTTKIPSTTSGIKDHRFTIIIIISVITKESNNRLLILPHCWYCWPEYWWCSISCSFRWLHWCRRLWWFSGFLYNVNVGRDLIGDKHTNKNHPFVNNLKTWMGLWDSVLEKAILFGFSDLFSLIMNLIILIDS